MTKVKFKLKKNDVVRVISGRDKGKEGAIVKVDCKNSKIIVSGVNLYTKSQKPSMNSQGGLKKIEQPIHISNVAYIDKKNNSITKIGYKKLDDGKLTRFAKKTGETIA